jgi:hypothetical protein
VVECGDKFKSGLRDWFVPAQGDEPGEKQDDERDICGRGRDRFSTPGSYQRL